MKTILGILLLTCATGLNASAFILQDGVSTTLYKPSSKAGVLDKTFGASKNGKITTTFSDGASQAYAVAIQPDGKIVVAGLGAYMVVARYNVDGSLDGGFGVGGKATIAFGLSTDDQTKAIALQADGKIVIGGTSGTGGVYNFALVRYNTNGSLDTTFGSGTGKVTTDFGGNNDQITGLAIQPDGKIVAVGYTNNGGSYNFAVARYKTNGSLDLEEFGLGTGKAVVDLGGTDDRGTAVVLQSDGKILIAGYSNSSGSYDFALVRYKTNGILDSAEFGADTGIVLIDFEVGSDDKAYGVALQQDGKIVLIGTSDASGDYDFALVRCKTDGTLDLTFGSGTGKVTTDYSGGNYDHGYAVALQQDGKIVAVGVTNEPGSYTFMCARYYQDGFLDTTFGTNGTGKVIVLFAGGTDDQSYAMAVQPDGKIVAAGYSNSTGSYSFALARYTTDIDPLIQSASLFVNGRGGLIR